MNREGAETFLRLLAEASMRDQLAPDPPPWAGGTGAGRIKVQQAGQALTAVRALDREAVQEVLADYDLAVSVRRLHGQGPRPAPIGTRRARPAWATRRTGYPGQAAAPPPPVPKLDQPDQPDQPDEPDETDETDETDDGTADRFVPIGLAVPFHEADLSAELYLLSFARTRAGARLFVLWGQPTLSRQRGLGLQQVERFPVGLFTVTDDRGSAYELDFTQADDSAWVSQAILRPAPPDGIRWLEIAVPPGPAVRVQLSPASGPPADEPQGGAPEISPAQLSAGEQLLIMLAEDLLMTVAGHSPAARPAPRVLTPRALQTMGTGLGAVIAALAAVGALPPDSPIPARLAALCAGLRIDGHEITAPPTADLPETWLSVLAYHQRRKPDTTQAQDGFAGLAAALPELDGIRLALVGLHNTEGSTVLHVLARGLQRERRTGPHGIDLDFPLSFWLRDSGGRWHAARPVAWHPSGREHSIELALVPPLPRSTAWVEVLAGGRSAQVRARLPLRWGAPP